MPWIERFVTEEGHHLPPRVSRGVTLLGRAGFAGRGLVYAAMGVLGVLAVVGVAGAEPTDAGGAMAALAEHPVGAVLVVLTGLGLGAYALWKVAQAVFDLEHHSGGVKGLAVRLFDLGDGLFHAGFAVFVFAALGRQRPDDGEETRALTADLMGDPLGIGLVSAVGGLTVLYGGWLLVRAWTTGFVKHLTLNHHGVPPSLAVLATARVGETARGVVFGLFGLFLVRAGLRADPGEARGLGESFEALADGPWGPWLVLLAAAGFVAYGLWGFVQAFWRDIGRGLACEDDEEPPGPAEPSRG